MGTMRIDCNRCVVRGDACDSCVISVLCGPPETVDFSSDEQTAIVWLAAAGLVPPLRMQTGNQASGTEG